MQLNDTLGNPVPIKCTNINCVKFDKCRLKYRQNGCEFKVEKEIKDMDEVKDLGSTEVENNKLIVVKQLPIIAERLKSLSDEIDGKIDTALAMTCTEDTVKDIKKTRADLNKDLTFLEEQRKNVKNEVMKPYNDFETIYKQYVSDKYKLADSKLKTKIDEVENGLKLEKEKEIKEYFNEYLLSKNIDFITYNSAKINVILLSSMKSLKEQAKSFIDRVCDDLELIKTQEHSTEILVEYKASLNASQAITTVVNRYKAITEMEARKAEQEAKRLAQQQVIEKVNVAVVERIHISPPEPIKNEPSIIEQPIIEESELTLAFKVTATKTKLVELKTWLNERGYKYE